MGLWVNAIKYRQVAELMEATSFPHHEKELETFVFISILHHLTVLKYSKRKDWSSANEKDFL